MSLYNSEHPYSNGLEVLLDTHSGDWPIMFALVAERLQKIELELADARGEIDKLNASGGSTSPAAGDASSPLRSHSG